MCHGCGGVAEFFNQRGLAGADGEEAAVGKLIGIRSAINQCGIGKNRQYEDCACHN